jgi:hypothetical protein
MSKTTAPNALVPSIDLTGVVNAEDFALDSHIGTAQAGPIYEMLLDRHEHGEHADIEVVVTMEGWSTAFPDADDPIVPTRILICGHIEDYSDSSYKIRGGSYVKPGKIIDYDRDTDSSYVLDTIDETDTDYVNKRGEKFLPKKAVDQIFVVE